MPVDGNALERANELKLRTKQLAARVFRLCRTLPSTPEAGVVRSQLLRCASSVAANYRAACRGRSKREFIAKLGIAVEEADETVFWLEFLIETDLVPPSRLRDLLQEANEILAIVAASQHTARNGNDSTAQ